MQPLTSEALDVEEGVRSVFPILTMKEQLKGCFESHPNKCLVIIPEA